MKNILILNGHWNNRGDESAIRAMVDSLHQMYPDAFFQFLFHAEQIHQFPMEAYWECKNLSLGYKKFTLDAFIVFVTHGKVALFKTTKKYIELLKTAKLVIHAPGGPSIGDVYQHAEPPYWGKLLIAKVLGVPYIFYAPSMGPFKNKLRNPIRKYILNHSELIVVRESITADYLKTLNLKKPVITALDSAFQNEINSEKNDNLLQSYIDLNLFLNRYDKVIGLTVTELEWHPTHKYAQGLKENIRDSFFVFLQFLEKQGYGVVFIPQLFGAQNDIDLMQKYAAPFSNAFVMDDLHDCYFQQYIIGQLYAVVGMRYHSNIFSAKMGTPFVSVSYEQKMQGFMEKAGFADYCLSVNELSDESLQEYFEKMTQNYPVYKADLTQKKEGFKREAHKTTDLVCGLLEKITERK